MSNSRKVGPFRIRPHIRNGIETGKWFVDIPASLTGNGLRKRKLYDTQKNALQVARELKRHADPVSGQLVATPTHSGLSFRRAVELWQEDEVLRVETFKKRASTFDRERYRLRSLVDYFGDQSVASITERRLGEYQRWRIRQGRKPGTINSDLRTFSLVLGWAKKHGYIGEVPKPERIPDRRKLAVIPTREEVVRIVQALPPRLQPLIRFLAETGCRKGEALNLTWDSVDEVNGVVEIRSREGWTPKTEQSERSIPINPVLLDLLRGLPKEGPYVFPGTTPDEPIGSFRKALKTAVARAGIYRRGKQVHITAQSLRKAHASWLAEDGVDESVLQGLLGHAAGSSVTRQYYVQATEKAKRAAVIQLPIPEQSENESDPDLAISGNKRGDQQIDLTNDTANLLERKEEIGRSERI